MATMMSPSASAMDSLRVPESSGLESGENTNDLHKLKEISEKLNLATRRPSVVQWKQIIEYRKSNGQYTGHKPLQYTGIMTRQAAKEIARDDANETGLSPPPNIPPQNTADSSPIAADHNKTTVHPPAWRHRRIAQTTIPELVVESPFDRQSGDSDVTNTMVALSPSSQVMTSSEKLSDTLPPFGSDVTHLDMTSRCSRISQAIEEMRRDLMIMRIEDNKLARMLLDVRSELTLIRAERSCEEHADMLDDVTFEMEEEEELTRLIKACDLSDGKSSLLLSHFSPLRHIGVSKMNLNIRRFSIR